MFTRFFPRCGVPDAFARWDAYAAYVRFLYETGSVDEHTQLWWSVRPHLAFPTVELRICDGQPDVGEAQSLAALMVSLTARCARALDEGEPLPEHPRRLIEENTLARDPLRPLGRADRSRARRGRSGAGAARAASRVGQPVAEEIGAAPWLRLPEQNAAERQIARRAEGATLEEIYAEQVGVTVPASPEAVGLPRLALSAAVVALLATGCEDDPPAPSPARDQALIQRAAAGRARRSRAPARRGRGRDGDRRARAHGARRGRVRQSRRRRASRSSRPVPT